MKGRKPKPTALKKLRGNPGQRKINPGEPTPGGKPREPRPLSKREQEIWDRLMDELVPSGVATRADSFALGRLVELEAMAEHARHILETLDGSDPSRGSWSVEYRGLSGQLVRLYSEFGMTAASRSRVSSSSPSAGGGIEEFLG